MLKSIAQRIPENNRLERIWVLAKTDFLKRYYGSFLGLVWAFLNPVIQLFIYYFVFTIVFKSQVDQFALFLFLGLILYMFFGEATTRGLNIFRSKRYLLENIPMNKLDIYYASILSAFFAFLFNFAAYFIISLFFPIKISIYILWFPIILLNLLVFILAVKLILSVVHVYLKDIVHVWDLAKMILLWMSGIFYPIDPSVTWKSEILAYLTPLPGLIENARNLLIYGKPINWTYFFYDWAYSLILLFFALWFFRIYSTKALEKL